MRTIYLLALVISFGATVYFINTPNEILFNVLFAKVN